MCEYSTSRFSQYERHLSTDKHKNNEKSTVVNTQSSETTTYNCECGKVYKERTGLWKHKQKCNYIDSTHNETSISSNTELLNEKMILFLINENQELKKMMIEQAKETSQFQNNMIQLMKNGINNTTNINSHNKSFNLNLFLNETCKDAMNITDFMHSLQVQLSDLVNVGEVGFINGISDIIVNNLKSLDISKRPVHCIDAKREVLYVKDENKWEKEGEENAKLRKAIKHVAHKNSKMLPEFRKNHPDCVKSDSKYSDQYNKLVIEAMGGKGDNDKEKEDKIIKKIAKEIVVQK
jgi:hypothetical protein